MSQSFYSIRERFETGIAQTPTTPKSYAQTKNTAIRVPLPHVVAFPEKNPPPSPVIQRNLPVTPTKNLEKRPEKVNSFSQLITEQSRNLRISPEVPQKPRKLSNENATSTSVYPKTPPKPSQVEMLCAETVPSSPIPSHTHVQSSLTVNRLRQQFEQAQVDAPVVSSKPAKDGTTGAQPDRAPQLIGNHSERIREPPPSRTRSPPARENLYDAPVYHPQPTTSQWTPGIPEPNAPEEEEIYANIPNQRLQLLQLTLPTPRKNPLPLPPRQPVYSNFASYERKAYDCNTLPRQFKLMSPENFVDKKSLLENSDSSYDSDFDDDDDEFGERGTTQMLPDESILGKYYTLNHTHERMFSGLSNAPRQRFSYAAPQRRPELKMSMSFNRKTHEKALIRDNAPSEDSAKYDKKLLNIASELISTEEAFVESLTRFFDEFNSMFQRKDIPRGLKDKKDILFWNIEEIIHFHRDTVLPMFKKHQKDLNSLFDHFSVLLDDHRFYEYVIFATNNKTALKIVDDFQPYFQFFQKEVNDPLGMQSFLLLPIQRLPRYELLLKDFKTALFEACSFSSKYFTQKTQVKALCDLEKKMKNLLNLVNEANVVCDIIGWTNLNLFNRENRFRKVLDDLFIYDYTLQQGYGGKVFIFDKFMIYTEVRGDFLVYHGCYDATKGIDLIVEDKAFKMAHRRVQVCKFHSETATHNQYCLSYIEDMIQSNSVNFYDQRSNTSSGNMSTVLEEDES